ncbi:zinc finger BED domain-containing protein 1-like [Rhizophagus clarus]|uniref:Zinc finger BED domain-containing protein 1-like n=1 Tax=Rhizophagus clarus TaxID=94130 RepID=A0A8H3LPK7_9GLOM|nr:zinc finger BED domain-containing protein 1-like [Rhizophagus clarus]
MELNNDEDNAYFSDSARTDSTAGTEASGRKRRRVLVVDKTDIWRYFNKLDPPKPKHKKGSCNVEIRTSKDVKICGHVINTDGSTAKVDVMFQKQWSKNPKRKRECDEALTEFLIDDMQPLYVLKNEGFINLVKTLDPYYTLPNLWTGRDHQGYIGVTCSFINKEFELQEIMLAYQYMEYPHTSQNIARTIMNLIFEWGLEKKFICITTDNGSNMVAASRLLPNTFRIPCAARTLNLVVNKGLIPVEILIARAKRLINFFMSPKQNERLKAIQTCHLNGTEDFSENHKYLRTIQDMKTRWNSSYLAWERLLKLHHAINILIATMSTESESDTDTKKDLKRLKEIMLSDDEWKLMKQLTKILQPFYDATKLLGGEKYATASFMYYVVATLQIKVIPKEVEVVDLTNDDDAFDDDIEFEDGDDDDVIIMQNTKRKIKIKNPLNCEGKEEEVKRNLYHLLHHYWENPAKEGMISALLDPRVKSLNFVSSLKKEGIISLLRDEYQFVKESEEFATGTTLNSNDLDLLESNNSLLIDMFAESQSAENEINDYLSLQQLSPKTDPYKCQKYLSISATSTSSERLFSQAGNIFPPEIYNEIDQI